MPSSDAFVYSACPFVSFVVKSLSQRRTPSNSNQYVFRRSDAASNRDFERGFEGPSGVGASISMFCASLSLLRRIISLLWRNYLPVTVLLRVHRQSLPNLLLLKWIFLQKPVRRPPILPVFRRLSGSIRENQGAKPLSNPGLIMPDHAELASPASSDGARAT